MIIAGLWTVNFKRFETRRKAREKPGQSISISRKRMLFANLKKHERYRVRVSIRTDL